MYYPLSRCNQEPTVLKTITSHVSSDNIGILTTTFPLVFKHYRSFSICLPKRLAGFQVRHAGRLRGNGLNGWRTVLQRRGSDEVVTETHGRERDGNDGHVVDTERNREER